ncbi:Bromodomain-containing protein 8, partial [Rhizopus azygosporus]
MSTTEWTILEKLLLSQAVYKYGEDNWFQIARNLKHHALLDRPSDYFNQKNCSLQYYLMIEDMDKEKRQQQSLTTQDMPVVVRLARQLYTQRLEELKKEISEDEEKFLALVSEIEEIRAGKWDDQLLKNSKEDIKKEDQSEKHLSESLETQETQEINASNDEKKTEEMTVVESENKQNEEITQSTDREQLGEKDINDNREQQLAIDNDVDQASNVDVSVQPEQEKQTNNVEQSLQSST